MSRCVLVCLSVAVLLPLLPARGADPADGNKALVKMYQSGSLFDRKQYRPLRAILANAFARKHADTIKDAFGADHEKLSEWLSKRPEVREELFVALDEKHDDLKAALALFAKLWKESASKIESHAPLAIATAVVWDQPDYRDGNRGGIYDYRHHQRRTKSTLPDGLTDARGNFDYLTGSDAVVNGAVKVLPWELLTFVVDHRTPIKERKWAQKYVLSRRGKVASWHQDIAYDHGMLKTEVTGKGPGPKLAGHEYTLENLKKYGGVCAQQADFVARVGKSMGQPSVYVSGESSYRGRHAWVMWVNTVKSGKSVRFTLTSDGRTRGFERDAFYTGTLNDPQTGQPISDRDLERRLSVIGNDPTAARQGRMIMRVYPELCQELKLGVKERLAYLDRCLTLVPQLEEAWVELGRLARDGELSGTWKTAAATKLTVLTKTFARHLDFICRLSDDFLTPEANTVQKVRHYERVVAMCEKAGRADLCCDLRLKAAKLQVEEKRYKEAATSLTQAVRKFPTEGRYIPGLLAAYEEVVESYPQGVTPLANLYVELGPALVKHYKGESNPFMKKVLAQAESYFEKKNLTKHAKLFRSRVTAAAGSR
jgi:hypothetical protein